MSYGDELGSYDEKEILRIAKRYGNTKRRYLIVNPLQGKHVPVSPSKAIGMFSELGQAVKIKFPGARLVIGFAETATAVGMGVANELGGDCIYIHTTREEVQSARYIEFKEEHSHAVQQRLVSDNLGKWIDGTDVVVFVDDEISTGKTLLNIVAQIKEGFPSFGEKRIVAASIINRVSDENLELLRSKAIECLSLVKMEPADYDDFTEKIRISEAVEAASLDTPCSARELPMEIGLDDPRIGVKANIYHDDTMRFAEAAVRALPDSAKDGKILVLGTEECMYPAIMLGRLLESEGAEVYTHSTTRSPIGISDAYGYPIWNGYRLRSVYDSRRNTYIYDVGEYRNVYVVTDSREDANPGIRDIASALWQEGSRELVIIHGPKN